ncbi:hypothetical protein [Silvanigrella sp.]|jgi:hypothetical protein|uniref:hypothetical protein n=1 Tax=Silvanigrella sp. TaxID=2024976 RepID=UPI0037C9270C
MKLRNTFLYISAFSLFNIFALNSYAVVDTFSLNNEADLKSGNDENKLIENINKNLSVDEVFTQGGMNYTLYKGLKAFVGKDTSKDFSNEVSSGNSPQDLSIRAPKTILLDKGAFKIFFDSKSVRNSKNRNSSDRMTSTSVNDFSDSESQESVASKSAFKVAFNNQTKKFAVVTGNAIVKVNPDKKVKIPNTSYQVLKSYKELGLYVIKVPENIKFQDAVSQLKKLNPYSQAVSDDKVTSVNVEVLENFKTPM